MPELKAYHGKKEKADKDGFKINNAGHYLSRFVGFIHFYLLFLFFRGEFFSPSICLQAQKGRRIFLPREIFCAGSFVRLPELWKDASAAHIPRLRDGQYQHLRRCRVLLLWSTRKGKNVVYLVDDCKACEKS